MNTQTAILIRSKLTKRLTRKMKSFKRSELKRSARQRTMWGTWSYSKKAMYLCREPNSAKETKKRSSSLATKVAKALESFPESTVTLTTCYRALTEVLLPLCPVDKFKIRSVRQTVSVLSQTCKMQTSSQSKKGE